MVHKSLTKLSISILLTLGITSNAFAFQCLVVSGLEKDRVGAFQDIAFLKEGFEVSGSKCKIFGSWPQLQTYVYGNAKNPAQVKSGESLLLLQGAHGGPGGSAACNAEDATGSEIYDAIKGISQHFKTGVVIDSCFSGDLMKRKLQDDLDNPSVAMDQLCLVTGSFFGRSSPARPDGPGGTMATEKLSDNMETLFLRSKGGMISSAGWDDAGVTQYLKSPTPEDAVKTIESMSRVVKMNMPDSVCLTSATLVASPMITKYNSEALLTYMNGDAQISASEMQTLFSQIDLISGGDKDPDASPKKKLGALCAKAWNEKLHDIRAHGGPIEVRQLYDLHMQFQETPAFDSCAQMDQLPPHVGIGEPAHHMMIILPRPFIDKYGAFVDAYKKLQPKGLVHSPSDDLSTILKNNSIITTIQDRNEIVDQVLGITQYRPESSKEGNPSEKIDEISPSAALNGFVRGSLAQPKFSSSNDQRRRKACQSFHFKDGA